MADQHVTPVADTPVDEPPKKKSRAGRDLPAAIAVGVALGAIAIGVLLFAPIGWLPVLGVAIGDRHSRGGAQAGRGRLRPTL